MKTRKRSRKHTRGGVLHETKEREALEDRYKAISQVIAHIDDLEKQLRSLTGRPLAADLSIQRDLYIQNAKDLADSIRKDIKPLLDRMKK